MKSSSSLFCLTESFTRSEERIPLIRRARWEGSASAAWTDDEVSSHTMAPFSLTSRTSSSGGTGRHSSARRAKYLPLVVQATLWEGGTTTERYRPPFSAVSTVGYRAVTLTVNSETRRETRSGSVGGIFWLE